MKRNYASSFLLLILLNNQIYAHATCIEYPGALYCHRGTVNAINYRGSVDVNGTIVAHQFKVQGNCHIQNAKLGNTSIRGISWFLATTVKGPLTVTGNISAQQLYLEKDAQITGNFIGTHIHFNDAIKIVGSIDCSDCQFAKASAFIGVAKITNSKFLGDLNLTAQTSVIRNSTVPDININKSHPNQVQTLTLCDKTHVNNINFSSQRGIVEIDASSTISGKVRGGKIIKKICVATRGDEL